MVHSLPLRSIGLVKHTHQRSFESRSRTGLDRVIPEQVSQNTEQAVHQEPVSLLYSVH